MGQFTIYPLLKLEGMFPPQIVESILYMGIYLYDLAAVYACCVERKTGRESQRGGYSRQYNYCLDYNACYYN